MYHLDGNAAVAGFFITQAGTMKALRSTDLKKS
jgi:hypothetical protein